MWQAHGCESCRARMSRGLLTSWRAPTAALSAEPVRAWRHSWATPAGGVVASLGGPGGVEGASAMRFAFAANRLAAEVAGPLLDALTKPTDSANELAAKAALTADEVQQDVDALARSMRQNQAAMRAAYQELRADNDGRAWGPPPDEHLAGVGTSGGTAEAESAAVAAAPPETPDVLGHHPPHSLGAAVGATWRERLAADPGTKSALQPTPTR